MSLKQKRLSNAYKGTGNYRDLHTVAQMSSMTTASSIGLPNSKFRVEKQTFEIGGTEYEFVTNVSVVTA